MGRNSMAKTVTKPGLLEAALPVLEAQLDIEPAEAATAILTIPRMGELLRTACSLRRLGFLPSAECLK